MRGRLTIHAVDTPCSLSFQATSATCTSHLSFAGANNHEHLQPAASYQANNTAADYPRHFSSSFFSSFLSTLSSVLLPRFEKFFRRSLSYVRIVPNTLNFGIESSTTFLFNVVSLDNFRHIANMRKTRFERKFSVLNALREYIDVEVIRVILFFILFCK